MIFVHRAVCATLLLAALASCSPEKAGHAPAAQAVGVAVEPAATSVQPGSTAQFAATVTGTADTRVTWAVDEASGGAVDVNGVYTAPASGGVFHVRATSRAAPAVSGQSTVTVAAPVAVAVSPKTPSVVAGGTVQFSATVSNATNTAVTWSVPSAGCGSISAAGLYRAPAVAAVCTVVATSQADPTRSDSATVTVTAPPAPVVVTVTPSPAAVDSCSALTFTATVSGSSDTAVAWSVQEGAAGGTISAAGVYTAPSSAGTYHVVATSHADPSRTAVVAVTVSDRILAVAVSPQTIQVPTGGTAQFTATVTTTCGTFTSSTTVTN